MFFPRIYPHRQRPHAGTLIRTLLSRRAQKSCGQILKATQPERPPRTRQQPNSKQRQKKQKHLQRSRNLKTQRSSTMVKSFFILSGASSGTLERITMISTATSNAYIHTRHNDSKGKLRGHGDGTARTLAPGKLVKKGKKHRCTTPRPSLPVQIQFSHIIPDARADWLFWFALGARERERKRSEEITAPVASVINGV